MHTSKLIQVLKTFSRKEIKDFGRYLNIAKGKSGEQCKALFKVIFKYHPDYKSSGLKKEKVFKRTYPTQIYNTGKLEKIMSHLFGLLQEFIVYQNSGIEKELHQIRVLTDFYIKKELYSFAEVNIKKYHKILKTEIKSDTSSFYDSFLLEKLVVEYQTLFYTSKKAIEASRVHLSLDSFYVFEKLELACRLLAVNRYLYPVVLEKKLTILEHLSPLLEDDFFDVPIIKLYYKAYNFLNCEEENIAQKFMEFEQALEVHYHSIPEEQLIPLVTIIRNYYIKQYHKGVEGYLEKTFYIYKDHLERGYLYVKDGLFASTMMNIVFSGLRLKKYDWVLNFIQTHKEKIIGTPSPVEAYKLNLANYYFHTAEYDRALDLLGYNYEDVYYKLIAKRMEIKIYFERNHLLLTPKIDAFKILIYRLPPNVISKKHKEGNRDFIDVLKQINLPKTYKNEKRIEKLATKISTSKFINEKDWLFEKLDALR